MVRSVGLKTTVSVYSVHCRVIVDNKSEIYHTSWMKGVRENLCLWSASGAAMHET